MTIRDLDSFLDGISPRTMPDGVQEVECRRALSKSKLPGLDYSLNPYVGCGHDCIYCYAPFLLKKAREGWARVGARMNMPRLLDSELRAASGIIGIGTVTDPYQPVEADLKLTRGCLEAIQRKGLGVSIHTKSDLVVRDLDVLRLLPEAEVGVTLTTVNSELARTFEPFAPSPAARLVALKRLVEAGVETYVLIGPIIPTVTDVDVRGLVSAISATGVKRAMLDKLRLRPGMLDHLKGMDSLRTDRGRRFLDRLEDRDYCLAIEREMAEELRRHGIAVEQAF